MFDGLFHCSTIKYCTISPTILEETFQLQGGFAPLTPTGVLPLDPAGGKPPDPHVSPPFPNSCIRHWCNCKSNPNPITNFQGRLIR